MTLTFETHEGPIEVSLTALTVAGWTGRDKAAVAHHVEELAAIGVPAPSRTPLFYQVSPGLATQAERISVLGPETSGEVEPFLLNAEGRLWLGIGSDHTDRALEAQSIAHAKQVCEKPLGRKLWPLDRVRERLDSLVLRSWIVTDGERRLYQEGTLAELLPLQTLLSERPLSRGEGMLCGTLTAIGGIAPAPRLELEMADPEGETLNLAYDVTVLEVVA